MGNETKTGRNETKRANSSEYWERQPGESDPAFAAFCAYRDMEDSRSIVKVAQACNKNSSLIARWSTKHKWRSRVEEYSRHQDSLKLQAKEKAIEQQGVREIKIGLKMMTLAQEHLKRFKPKWEKQEDGTKKLVCDKMSAFEARMLAVDGAKLIKSGLGEPETTNRLEFGGQTFADLAKLARGEKPEE